MATAASALRGFVLQGDHIADLAFGIRQHSPGDARDLLCPQTAFERQQKHRAIPEGVAPGIQFGQDGSNLIVRENFRLLAESHQTSMKADKISTLMAGLYYRLKRWSIESRVKVRRNAKLIGEFGFSNS